MVGSKQPPKPNQEPPFVTGQYLGMLTILTFIEENNGIDKVFLYKLKEALASKTAENMEKPTEDIYLMVDDLVKNIGYEDDSTTTRTI
jgi:hypothetical protein